MTQEQSNEEMSCIVIAHLLEKRYSLTLRIAARPDKEERRRPAVELRCVSDTRKFAFEHTRIESFPTQIADGATFTSLLQPLADELRGQLPGHFWLLVSVGATRNVRADQHDVIRRHIRTWILQTVPDLVERRKTRPRQSPYVRTRIEGVPFEVTLQHTGLSGSVLRIVRYAPDDLEERRLDRIRTALAKKCPKLAAEKAAGFETVLILESNDIALGGMPMIAAALQTAVAERADGPDLICLVETEIPGWIAWLLKEDDKFHDAIGNAGPFSIG